MRFVLVCILCAFLGYALVLGLSQDFKSAGSFVPSGLFENDEMSEIWTKMKRRFWDQDIPRRKVDKVSKVKNLSDEEHKSLKGKIEKEEKSHRAEIKDLSPHSYEKGLLKDIANSDAILLESVKKKKRQEKQDMNALIESITE